MKTVGILGGGQLGLMLANSIYTLGGQVVAYDPDANAPLARHTNKSFCSSWQDFDLIEKFVRQCDIITYEFENVEVDPLRPIAELRPIYPGLDVLAVTQNRMNEKEFLKKANLPHVQFEVASTINELNEKKKQFKYPYVIKTARGGYDGKGQYIVKAENDFEAARNELSKLDSDKLLLVLEEFLPIESEISAIVARQLNGEVKTFPVFENFHKNHILDKTVLPSKMPDYLQEEVKKIAVEATMKLDVKGLLTTEFFITKNDGTRESGKAINDYRIYINEFAPRPHNSGHITRNACHMSQFDALARILLEIPLTSCELNSEKTHCMVNILGDTFLEQGLSPDQPEKLDLSSFKDHQNLSEIVLYGKKEARPGRKMGHLVCFANSYQNALDLGDKLKNSLSRVMK